eukprot:m.130758 g.130758  ORF g.130758 m.130758 type:complete len:94 (-) comp14608_c0_seq2:336-617(-)
MFSFYQAEIVAAQQACGSDSADTLNMKNIFRHSTIVFTGSRWGQYSLSCLILFLCVTSCQGIIKALANLTSMILLQTVIVKVNEGDRRQEDDF